VNDEEAVSICAGVAEKYRKVAVSPEGLFRYPTGEESARGLGYPPSFSRHPSSKPRAVRRRGESFCPGPIHPGEAVLDLGCGAVFECFVAAHLVGPTGRVAGVDLSPEMIAVAEADLRQTEFSRVQFRVGKVGTAFPRILRRARTGPQLVPTSRRARSSGPRGRRSGLRYLLVTPGKASGPTE
jgi:SAM-dependent methyltransferase